MTILDELGIDPENFEWNALALCQNVETNDFFDNYEKDVEIARAIDRMCFSCPVQKQCLMSGIENKEHGVWGGVYLNGAGRADPAKNSHKTPEDWEVIKGLINDD